MSETAPAVCGTFNNTEESSMKIVLNSGKVKEAPLKLRTVYYFRAEPVRVTRGTNLYEAGLNVMRNLQINKYGATYAEVLDADTGQLFYSQSRSMSGQISKPHYEWDPADTHTRFGVHVLLGD